MEGVVYSDTLSVRDRAAAILVVVFGQHIEDVIQLTWDDITVKEELVTVRLGKAEFALPFPPGRTHAPAPGGAGPRPHRVPPEQQLGVPRLLPGQHIRGATLRQRLKVVFNTRAA